MKTLIILLLGCLSSVSLLAQKHDKPVGLKYIDDALVGDNPHQFYSGPAINYNDPVGPIIYSKENYVITLQEVSPNARTYYDMQSNACVRFLWQEQTSPNKMHAIFMTDPVGDFYNTFPDRKTKYFYSTNGGSNWSYVIDVPNGVRSGYPYITVMDDGRAMIMNHSTTGGGDLRTQLFIDVVSGGNSFTRLDPGVTQLYGNQTIWPAGVSTSNNKVVFLSSQQTPDDTAFRNSCTNLSGSGTFSGYVPIIDMNTANCYSIARTGNKVGIAYITGYFSYYSPGSLLYMESNDNGITWSSPAQVWIGNYFYDSLAAFRSVDLTFQGTSPKVIFGLAKLDEYGYYYPWLPSKMMLWSPNVNGGVPVTIDSADGLNGSNWVNDVFVSVTRGVVGTSADGQVLYAAWNRARSDTDEIGDNYFDVYFSYSVNGGLTWEPKMQVTNNSGPLRDCRYISISPSNNIVSSDYFVHLIYQSDSIPASYVNGAPKSLARMMYARLDLGNIFTGIGSVNSEVPKSFVLGQNFPNPFNPRTVIDYELPVSGLVRLTIYDILGREVETLVNEIQKVGKYQVTLDAGRYASGVYFYKLNAGDFVQTKKMVLIK